MPDSAADRSRLLESLLVWASLQIGGLATLLAGFALASALFPQFGREATFLGRWGTSFVLVPITFAPVLAVWHSWAIRRHGRRLGFLRLVAEVAFAAELVGCVLYQRLA